jgi:hypothetical protein
VSGADEASELRKLLKEAQATVDALKLERDRLAMANADWARRFIEVEGSVFGCSACGGDHRSDVFLQKLAQPFVVKEHACDRAIICPTTAKVVFFEKDGKGAFSA